MSFCGWIKEAHVGRPQRSGPWARGLVVLLSLLLFFFFFYREAERGTVSLGIYHPYPKTEENEVPKCKLKTWTGGVDVPPAPGGQL